MLPTLAFQDEFTAPSLGASWKVYSGPGNAGIGLRSPDAVTLADSRLTITASMQNGQLVSGGIALRTGQVHGRFEACVRCDADVSGLTSAVVLTWPDTAGWPAGGESDFYETGPNPSRSYTSSTVHYTAGNRMQTFRTYVDCTQWHTVTMDWTASELTFYVDGRLAGWTNDPAAIATASQHLCLQLDAVKAGTLAAPVSMQVDWVRLYTF